MEISLPKTPDIKHVSLIVEKLRNESLVEHLYFVKNGKAFVWFEGFKNYVYPQPEQMLRMNDALVLHNHLNGTSFSYEDIDALTKYNARELMIICKARTYHIKRAGNKWPFSFDKEEDYKEYQYAFNKANEYIDQLVEEREMEESERSDFINHITWKLFFPKFEIEYKTYGL